MADQTATAEQVAAIRARLERLPNGQRWIATQSFHGRWSVVDAMEDAPVAELRQTFHEQTSTADFIAHAPEDMAALLTDRDRLARRVGELEAERGTGCRGSWSGGTSAHGPVITTLGCPRCYGARYITIPCPGPVAVGPASTIPLRGTGAP